MQTTIAAPFRGSPLGEEADRILRSCVHCGFCTATCPTYQITGDELDSPRGRIYLIKSLREGDPDAQVAMHHLDRCLGCRACESTCPSGVRYGRLLELGRAAAVRALGRGPVVRMKRLLLRSLIPHRPTFTFLLRSSQLLRPWLPARLAQRIPARHPATAWPRRSHERRMLLLESCAQSGAAPNTNAAAARVLDRLGIEVVPVPKATCCGALDHHLDARERARQRARRNIDAWWPHIEQGAEAILITASGCGSAVKEYGAWLKDDPVYRDRAGRVAALTRDLSEVLEGARGRIKPGPPRQVAFHSPCSLQHAQRITGVVEGLLRAAGCELTPVPEPHLCCGSAGPYSLLQPELANALRARKLEALQSGNPQVIVTANIGCQLHLQSGTAVPVRHWVELIDEVM